MKELRKSPVVFCEHPHGYHLGENRLSGITSLIREVLHLGQYPEASDYARNYLIPRAGEYGTAVHHAIETYDELCIKETVHEGKYGTWEVSTELENYIKNKEGFTSIANEYTVSDEVRYASNIDNVWLKNETQGIWLVDTKTNNLEKYHGGEEALKEYLSWQLSIYAYLFERQNPDLHVEGLACNWLRHEDSRFWTIGRKDDEDVKTLLSVPWEYVDGKFVFHGVEAADKLKIHLPATGPKYELLAPEIIKATHETILEFKRIESLYSNMKSLLREAMENANIKSWDAGPFKVTIGCDSTVNTFDSKRFKADYPELFKAYSKQTTRKGGFTITLKE